MRCLRYLGLIAVTLVSGLFSCGAAVAETEEEIKQRVNAGTVSVITEGLEYASNTYGALARDLVAVLDEEKSLRVVPIMGHGAVRNIEDMLYLRGVDIGMVHSDILKYLELEGKLLSAQRHLRLITKLYDEPFHVVARKEITEFTDLKHKPVAVGPRDSGADSSGRTFLRLLNLEVDIVNLPWPEAVEQLKSGALAAIIYPTRRGSKFIQKLSQVPSLQLLSLPPADATTLDTYSPVTLTSEDYPGFIGKDESRNTLQMAAILTVFNWRPDSGVRYTNVSMFIERLFARMDNLRAPLRHPVWGTVNLGDDVKGWQRYGPVQKLLDRVPRTPVAVGGPLGDDPASLENFERFMKYMRTEGGKPNASEQEFFDEYIKYQVWRAGQQQTPSAEPN